MTDWSRLLPRRFCCFSLRRGAMCIAVIDILAMAFLMTVIALSFHRKISRYSYNALVGELVELLIHVVVALLLVVGIWKLRCDLLWAWVGTRSVVLGTDVVLMLVSSSVDGQIVTLVSCLCMLPVYTYFVLVVHAYALTMKDDDDVVQFGDTTSVLSDDKEGQVSA